MTARRVSHGAQGADRDPMLATGRQLFYLGVLTLPWLTLRVGSLTVSDLLLFLSLGFVIASRPFRQAKPASQALQVGAFLAIAGALLSEFRDPAPTDGFAAVLRLCFVWVIWAWQAKQVLEEPKHIRRCIQAFAVGGAISGLAALGQYRFGLTIPGSELTATFRASGLAQHPNDLGGALSIALVIGFAAIARSRSLQTLGWLALVACCAVGLVLAGTVTGMLAGFAGILCVLALRKLNPRTLFTTALGLVAAAWVALRLQGQTGDGAGLSPMDRFAIATGSGTGAQDTTESRIATWRAAWGYIGDNPVIGRGFSDARLKMVDEIQTHNLLLGFWVAGGLLALLGVALIWTAAWSAGVHSSKTREREQLLAAFFTSFVFSMTAPILYQRYSWFPVIMLFALASVAKEARPESPAEELVGRSRPTAARPLPSGARRPTGRR